MGLDTSELPTASHAAIAMTALLQESHAMQGAYLQRQELTSEAELMFLEEPQPSRRPNKHERLKQSKAEGHAILTRLDQIEADIKWLSLAASVELGAGSQRRFVMDDATFCGGGKDIIPLSDLEAREANQEVFAALGQSPRKQ